MNDLLADVAHAALPVALGLLALGALARGVLALSDDEPALRFARAHLEPLSTWCLAALALHAFALVAAGRAGFLALLLDAGLAAFAILLRVLEDADATVVSEDEVPAVTAPLPSPPPTVGLWARPTDHRRG